LAVRSGDDGAYDASKADSGDHPGCVCVGVGRDARRPLLGSEERGSWVRDDCCRGIRRRARVGHGGADARRGCLAASPSVGPVPSGHGRIFCCSASAQPAWLCRLSTSRSSGSVRS